VIANKADDRPAWQTPIRCASLATPGSSLDITLGPRSPARQSPTISLLISPCRDVGCRGLARPFQHAPRPPQTTFAETTFCWFPPERVLQAPRGRSSRSDGASFPSSLAVLRPARLRLQPTPRKPPRTRRARPPRGSRGSNDDKSLARRSSVTKANPPPRSRAFVSCENLLAPAFDARIEPEARVTP